MEKNWHNEINRAVVNLKKGKTILYPTDTIWGIGCDVTNKQSIKKIFQIKERSESKSLIVLVNGLEMLQEYVKIIPEKILDFIKKQTQPTTIIYNHPKNLAKNLIAKDNTIAIRIVNTGFVHELIQAFGKPIVSTSANISGNPTPKDFQSINENILNNVDFVVNLPLESNQKKPSKMVRFSNDKIEIIRD